MAALLATGPATTGPATTDPATPVLQVKGLRVEYPTSKGTVRAVDGISFDVAAREIVALWARAAAARAPPRWPSCG